MNNEEKKCIFNNTPEQWNLLLIGVLLICGACLAIFELIGSEPVPINNLGTHTYEYRDERLSPTPLNTPLSEMEARMIAEESCVKGGEVLGRGVYNEGTRAWWFDANLNSIHEGCNPACVVSEPTRTAEINWRCTGAIPPIETPQEPWVPSERGETPNGPVVCTMDAKLCPDGSAVGRVGPRCEFAPCPHEVE